MAPWLLDRQDTKLLPGDHVVFNGPFNGTFTSTVRYGSRSKGRPSLQDAVAHLPQWMSQMFLDQFQNDPSRYDNFTPIAGGAFPEFRFRLTANPGIKRRAARTIQRAWRQWDSARPRPVQANYRSLPATVRSAALAGMSGTHAPPREVMERILGQSARGDHRIGLNAMGLQRKAARRKHPASRKRKRAGK